MKAEFHLTNEDIKQLKSLPVSISRIMNEAVRLLENPEEIDDDQGVTADYLRELEPLLNRLFSSAKEAIVKRRESESS